MMHGNFDDKQVMALLARVAARRQAEREPGDAEAALRELYDLVGGRLYGVALRVLGNRDWAEDALQETFLNIWRSAADYSSSLSPPMAWLGLIARSRALDLLRRRASERADAAVELDDVLAETVPGDSPDPLDSAEASQQARAVHECLRKLEGRQRELVSLAYFGDLSHSELAARLSLPLGTVKTWVRRALEQLRGCLAGYA